MNTHGVDRKLEAFFDLLRERKELSDEQISNARDLIVKRYQSGQKGKYLVVALDVLAITLVIILIGAANIFGLKLDERATLINGIIAFQLAVAAFIPSLKLAQITADEISSEIGRLEISSDDMNPIQKLVEQDISRHLTFVGACGVFATVLSKISV